MLRLSFISALAGDCIRWGWKKSFESVSKSWRRKFPAKTQSREAKLVLYSFAPPRETLSLFFLEKLAEFFAKLGTVLMAV